MLCSGEEGAQMSPVETSTADDSNLDARLQSVGSRLNAAMRDLIDAVPGGPHRAYQLASALSLKKDLAHRVVRATSQADPVASMHLMPGPEALRRLLDAAESREVSDAVLSAARDAIIEFEELIRMVAGTRSRFDYVLSGWLPEARERVDVLCRQSVYRGMAGIKGLSAELKFSAAILTPGDDDQFVDIMFVFGATGLTRLRPGVKVRFSSRHFHAPSQLAALVPSLDPMDSNGEPLQLEQFLAPPIGRLIPEQRGKAVHFVLEGDSIGNDSAANVVMTSIGRAAMNRYEVSPEAPRKRGPITEVDLPIEALNFDVIVHRDVYPDSDPELTVFDTGCRGNASVNDPTRAIDRLEHFGRLERVSGSPAMLRLAEIPAYNRMIARAMEYLEFTPESFRAYRWRTDYPVYGSSAHASFTAPPSPE